MTDKYDIIEEHLLGRKLIGVWEMISDSFPTTVEGYALSLEGYFLEIETMLDVSVIGIACGHSRIDFPLDVRPGCSYHEVSHDSPFSQLLGKRFSKWRLLVGEGDNWEGLMVSFDTSAGLCFISVDCSISVLTLKRRAVLMPALSRRGKLGVSCRVKVPVGRKFSNDFL